MSTQLKVIMLSAAALCWSPASATGIVDDSLGDCSDMVEAMGAPVVKGSGRTVTLVCRQGHVLAHNDSYKTPIWVVERLTKKRFIGDAQRSRKWKSDPDLQDDGRPVAVDADYSAASKKKGRVYDRGHMAPAASMKSDADAMRESFFLSNAAPQQGHLLNQHIWADLEFMIRDWACDRGELYVVTGPIYDTASPDTVGEGVAVPTAFFKVAYEPRQRRAIAIIMPNEEIDKAGVDTATVIDGYVVVTSEVERRAGIRLFDALPARDRSRILRTKPSIWGVVNGCGLRRG